MKTPEGVLSTASPPAVGESEKRTTTGPLVDVAATEQRVNAAMSAATTVTQNAQAAVTLVPTIPSPPSWFVPVQNDLAAAQNHAQNWLDQLCPAINGNIPQSIVDFNGPFQASCDAILDVLNAVSGGAALSQDDCRQVDDALANVTTAIVTQQQSVGSLIDQVKSYFSTVASDQDALQNDLGIVSNQFAESHIWIQKMTAVLGDSFVDSTILGPCNAIVGIDLNLSIQLGNIGVDPTISTLVIAKAILQNQVANDGTTLQALQSILDTWTTLKVKFDAVISDLEDASSDAAYLAILARVDLAAAQLQWQQLADFASALLPSPGTASRRAATDPPSTAVHQEKRMPPVSLATNVPAEQQKLAGYLNAKAQVAAYVAALQNTDLSGVSFTDLPSDIRLPGNPTKLIKAVRANLVTAKQHGQTWSNDIQPSLTSIPQAIINYNSTFQSTLSLMVPLLLDLFQDPSDTAKRAEVSDLFGGLLEKIGEQQTALTTEMTLLKQFNTDVTNDHGNFASGNNQFAAILAIEKADIKNLNAAITALNGTIKSLNKAITVEGVALGVSAGLVAAGAIGFANAETGVGLVVGAGCLVVGLVGVGVSAGFLITDIEKRQEAEQQKDFDALEVSELTLQVQALSTTQTALSSLVTQSAAAIVAVQVILDTWATLTGKLTAVVADLDDAEKEIGDILSVVDLNTAGDQWGQLETFANQMQAFESVIYAQPAVTLPLPTPMKVRIKPSPTHAQAARSQRRPVAAKRAVAGRKGVRP